MLIVNIHTVNMINVPAARQRTVCHDDVALGDKKG